MYGGVQLNLNAGFKLHRSTYMQSNLNILDSFF